MKRKLFGVILYFMFMLMAVGNVFADFVPLEEWLCYWHDGSVAECYFVIAGVAPQSHVQRA